MDGDSRLGGWFLCKMKGKPRTIEEKMRACKGLRGKSVVDIIKGDGFRSNLEAYVEAQRAERRVALDHAQQFGGGKMHAPAHAIDKTMDWSIEDWRDNFAQVVAKISPLPAAVREYVFQLGMQAYNVTIANLVILEFPELREHFFGKSKVV
ncbi:MAG: hypothetical protein J6T35_01445 [Bacteroidales bacterium]|nr:hypothetical protein [Bacteroidales bacterium]